MEEDIRALAEKYFGGECTRAEAGRVLAWFDTPEGEKYLSERLERDLTGIDEYPAPELYRQVPTSRIRIRLDKARRKSIGSSGMGTTRNRYVGILATAASLLLLITASVVIYTYSPQPDQSTAKQVAYTAGIQQHKVLSLSDGSTVRLNSNSRLTLPEVFRGNRREVILQGEAFFEINPNPGKPFIVHTAHAVIKVLGTAFNVKASASAHNVQVAVREGKVSFRPKTPASPREVFLRKNQLGYLQVENDQIKVEQVRIDNYLSWMTRRLVFDNTPLPVVCAQLERLYEIRCSIGSEELTGLHFTANFERRSLKKTLDVIARSLEIEYQVEENIVTWTKH